MAWKQVRNFDPKKMGTRKGYCLQNTRLGFGIMQGHFPSAKADMLNNKNKGTLHNMPAPNNVAVPVYTDTSSPYEHVMVCDHGTFYSDGRRLTSTAGMKFFGWGEICDGVRVVEWANDPQPTTGFLPAKGYWKRGDNDPRIGTLDEFYYNNYWGYFCKTKAQAKALLAGNLFGANTEKWTKEFQRRTGLKADGMVGPITYAKLKQYGFKG